MSFAFKTRDVPWHTVTRMSTPPAPRCPAHTPPSTAEAAPGPGASWPPGPPAGLTGWGLLARMSRDLLGTLATWQREHGDVVHLRIWPEHEVVLTDPGLVRELLLTHHDALIRWEHGIEVFTRMDGHSVFTAEGEPWHTKRQALVPAFAPRPVQAFVPAVADVTQQSLANWPARATRWPIESALTSLAMDVIVRMMFSSELGSGSRQAESAVHTLIVASNAELYRPLNGPDWLPWKRAKRQALAHLKRLIDSHLEARLAMQHADWPHDLLSRLLELHRTNPASWSLQAVHDECMTAFLAGHETIAATMTWWAWCMAAHPQAQEAARREVRNVLQGQLPTAAHLPSLRYLTQTLQETLRLYPATPLLFTRRATRAITLGAWQLPARTMFMIPVQLMQHDPRWFPQPLAFRPERFGPDGDEFPRGAYLPFGAGPRVCLGQHLAMAEMTVIAAMVLQRTTLSVPEGMTAPRAVLNVSLRPEEALHLTLRAGDLSS